jgi:hypothetical protein
MIGIPEMIAETKRELTMRRRVYPRLVGRGTMTAADAERRIAVMQIILDTLEALAPSGETPHGELPL